MRVEVEWNLILFGIENLFCVGMLVDRAAIWTVKVGFYDISGAVG